MSAIFSGTDLTGPWTTVTPMQPASALDGPEQPDHGYTGDPTEENAQYPDDTAAATPVSRSSSRTLSLRDDRPTTSASGSLSTWPEFDRLASFPPPPAPPPDLIRPDPVTGRIKYFTFRPDGTLIRDQRNLDSHFQGYNNPLVDTNMSRSKSDFAAAPIPERNDLLVVEPPQESGMNILKLLKNVIMAGEVQRMAGPTWSLGLLGEFTIFRFSVSLSCW